MWALKIEEGSVAGAGSLNWFVQSWEASEKLWRVAVPHSPLASCRLPCNMTLSQRRVTPVNVMFSGCQIRP